MRYTVDLGVDNEHLQLHPIFPNSPSPDYEDLVIQ